MTPLFSPMGEAMPAGMALLLVLMCRGGGALPEPFCAGAAAAGGAAAEASVMVAMCIRSGDLGS